ncbi:cytochrome c oxidase subunit V [Auriculariales sp. MPI-PUGE-AT-0066]|nr:cytochrome c oxidase subunit V [Auriculariales sp. MPI-PUGE-AT-0066]
MQAVRLIHTPLNTLRHSFWTSSLPVRAASATAYVQNASAVPLSNVEAQWSRLSSNEQLEVHSQLGNLQKKDWKSLSTDEKKAAYYVAFGPHGPRTPSNPPGTATKVFLGTMAMIGISSALFWISRTVAPPNPKTMTREWQEATNKIALERRQDPISGIASEGYKGQGHIQANRK